MFLNYLLISAVLASCVSADQSITTTTTTTTRASLIATTPSCAYKSTPIECPTTFPTRITTVTPTLCMDSNSQGISECPYTSTPTPTPTAITTLGPAVCAYKSTAFDCPTTVPTRITTVTPALFVDSQGMVSECPYASTTPFVTATTTIAPAVCDYKSTFFDCPTTFPTIITTVTPALCIDSQASISECPDYTATSTSVAGYTTTPTTTANTSNVLYSASERINVVGAGGIVLMGLVAVGGFVLVERDRLSLS
ncbi:hypothetical protein HDU76_003272 [Blyttiomyces sp. JEL0837]|nr:hypothetical protein HDU76_003272 [Blyttiomyces sp. JEL0837]